MSGCKEGQERRVVLVPRILENPHSQLLRSIHHPEHNKHTMLLISFQFSTNYRAGSNSLPLEAAIRSTHLSDFFSKIFQLVHKDCLYIPTSDSENLTRSRSFCIVVCILYYQLKSKPYALITEENI